MNIRNITALAICLAAATGASAVEYKVWYHDEQGFWNPGEITQSNAKLVPPAWACGRRFFTPSWYAWVGDDENLIASGNFNGDINVWLPLGGNCPFASTTVKRKSDGAVYAKPVGTHYLGVHTSYGGYWIDNNGGWPACNCTAPSAFKRLAADVRWPAAGKVLASAREALQGGSATALQARLRIDDASLRVAALQGEVGRVVGERRRTSLPTIETSLRALEDQAIAATAAAATQIANCSSHALAGQASSAHLACSEAGARLETAAWAVKSAMDELR